MNVDDINYDKFFKSMKQDFEEFRNKTKYKGYANSTIKAVNQLFKTRNEIAGIKKNSERNSCIQKITKLFPEGDFVTGKNKEQRLQSILEKTNLLKEAYFHAKENKQLEDFFRNAFISDPCFNGRIIALTNYVAEKQSGFSKEALEEKHVKGVPNELLLELLDLMYKLPEDEDVTKAAFEKFLKQEPNYESKYKKWVTSEKWNEIYNLVKASFF